MSEDDWFPLAELTSRLGALAWVEHAVGEVLCGWSITEPDPGIAIFFDTCGRHHLWHAQVVRGCLPSYESLVGDEAEHPPTSGWTDALDAMAMLGDPAFTGARLQVLVKAIDPWLTRELGVLVDLANPVSDAAVTRWLRFVMIDHSDDEASARVLLAGRADDAVSLEAHQRVQLITRSVVSPPARLD